MHKRVIKFCTIQTARFKSRGIIPAQPDVLDCGSNDINGNNRYLFPDAGSYTGIDIVEGPNVDVVSKISEFRSDKLYDVVISTEVLEHDKEWKKSLKNMVQLLNPGGFMLITAAGPGRPEHGTSKCLPDNSPLTNDYYKNIDMKMLADGLGVTNFCHFEMRIVADDIQFVGIKKYDA